jgi:hypothetical protein
VDALLWPPGEKKEPLYWYSHLPPQFGDLYVDDDFDRVRCSAHVTRGTTSSALYNIKDDPRQEWGQYAEHPEVVEQLHTSLHNFLTSINVPREQFTHLGLSHGIFINRMRGGSVEPEVRG